MDGIHYYVVKTDSSLVLLLLYKLIFAINKWCIIFGGKEIN